MIRTLAIAAGIAIASPAAAQGLYVNAFAGAMLFDQTVTVGGVKMVDLGGDAFLGGARIGWSHTAAGGLYLGAEAEAFGATGRARAMVNGTGYTYRVDAGVGAFGIIGWRTPGRATGFLRAGPMLAFTNQGDDLLAMVGIGAEIPIAPRWAARLDADYAWGNGVEHYRATAGIVWRFQ